MRSLWLKVLGCLCVMATRGHSAVVPTQESLVITKSKANPESIEEALRPEPKETPEGPLPPIKVLELMVQSDISARYARTQIISLVKNSANRQQEYTFSVLLSQAAFISEFSIVIGGKEYKAIVKEKEAAQQIYNDAVKQGLSAGHVAAKARDSNQFKLDLNIPANTSVVFILKHEEMLVRRRSFYQLALNLHTGYVVPKLNVSVHIKESQKITALRVPEISTGNEVADPEKYVQNPTARIKRTHDDREVTIMFQPSLEEQKKLMEVYARKSNESEANAHKFNSFNDEKESETEGSIGQFTVQYDVDRSVTNEILVNDGYFVHFFAPDSLPTLNKHVVFLLDTSGSMMGRKMDQLKVAMKTILEALNLGDYFSIVGFASSVKVHDLKEADGPEPQKSGQYVFYERDAKPATLIPPYKASPENIAKAKIIVDRFKAAGGTNIASGLDVVIDICRKGINWKPEEPVKESTEESTTPESERTTTESAPNAKTSKNIKPKSKPENDTQKDENTIETIIIFLTDGEPTVGETNPKRIISTFSEKNYGKNQATIFCLGFGDDADRNFMRKLALRNAGFSRHIYEAGDAALQLGLFYKEISSPAMNNVTFTYLPDQVKEGSLTKSKFRTFYTGGELIVAGQTQRYNSEVSPVVSGFCGTEDGVGRKRYEDRPRVIMPKKHKDNPDEFFPLEYIWAYVTVKQLLDKRDIAEELDKPKEERTAIEKEALDIALKYSFVTELTSLVVVKPNETNTVNAESVDKSKNSPNGAPLSSAQMLPGATSGQAQFAPSAFKAVFSPNKHQVVRPFWPQDQSMHEFMLESEDDFDYAIEDGDYFDENTSLGGGASPIKRVPSTKSAPLSSKLGPVHNKASFRPVADKISGPPVAQDQIFEDMSPGGTPNKSSLPPAVQQETGAPKSLKEYHLDEYSWALPILDDKTDELVLQPNGANVRLKLSKDVDALQKSGDACGHATDGGAGVCMYLPRCDAAKNITADLYTSTYCLIDNQFAGVCCPKAYKNGTESFENNNPSSSSVELEDEVTSDYDKTTIEDTLPTESEVNHSINNNEESPSDAEDSKDESCNDEAVSNDNASGVELDDKVVSNDSKTTQEDTHPDENVVSACTNINDDNSSDDSSNDEAGSDDIDVCEEDTQNDDASSTNDTKCGYSKTKNNENVTKQSNEDTNDKVNNS